MRKIWIDTDIGGDIDDALALLLAISLKDEIEILGVSTVFENTTARAKIAKTLFNFANMDVKVYAGKKNPYKIKKVFHDKVDTNKYPITYIKDLFDEANIEKEDALYGLTNALKNNKDVTIITIGALTNIADLIKTNDECLKNIKEIVIMGGAINMNLNEFNISCDPDAAKIVLDSNINKRIISLDMTFRCELSMEQTNKLFACKSKLVKTVMNMSKMWGHTIFLHDPLALSEAIKNEYVTFANGKLDVITKGRYAKGKLINLCDFNWHHVPLKTLLISSDVKNKEFCEYYVNTILKLDEKMLQNK